MAQNASKQGRLDSFAAKCLFIFLPCMWGLGFNQIAFEPGLDRFWTRVWCIPEFGAANKVSFARIFSFFLQFRGFEGNRFEGSKAISKPAPNPSTHQTPVETVGVSKRFPNFWSDSVKRHLSRRHLSVLNVLFNFIFDGGCTCERKMRFCSSGIYSRAAALVHRIAAFAFAMAIPRCQWRHRCDLWLLVNFLLFCTVNHCGERGKWKQRRKGDARDVKHYHGRCWKTGCASLRSALQRCGALRQQQSENAGPRFFGFVFRRCPPPWIFFPIFRAQHYHRGQNYYKKTRYKNIMFRGN